MACCAAGCLSPTGAVMTDVPVRGWQEAAVVTVENADTVISHDLYLLLRRNDLFTADTLRLTVSVSTPDSLFYSEETAFPIFRTRHTAAVRDILRIPYRRRALLSRTGNYRIAFTPLQPVSGIEAVGIDIVKNE